MEKRISELRQRIEHWRRTRRRQAAMPAELWEEAVQLAAQSSVSLVSRRLRLGHNSLKVRVLSAELGRCDNNEEQTGFVELESAKIFSIRAPLPSPLVEVELSRPDGARMRFRLPLEFGDVKELAALFYQRGGRQ